MNRSVNKDSGARDWNSLAARFHHQEFIEPTWEPSSKLDRTVRYRDFQEANPVHTVSNRGGTAEKIKPHFRPYLKGEMGYFDWR